MKRNKLLTLTLLPLVASIAPITIACSNSNPSQEIKVAIEGNSYLLTNKQIKLEFKINADKKIDSFKWSSSDDSIATVDQNGNVNGKLEGKTIINFDIVIEGKTYTAAKEITVIDETRIQCVEFINKYSEFLNNFLASTKEYKVEPVGKYEDMEWHSQIVEKMILTKFQEYPNKYFLRIFTLKQRTFSFVTAGNTLDDMVNIIFGLYVDSLQELSNEEMYSSDYYLKVTYEISDESISYSIVAQTDNEQEQKYYLAELKINKNGFIEKFSNTTNSSWVEHQAESGVFEVKYTEK